MSCIVIDKAHKCGCSHVHLCAPACVCVTKYVLHVAWSVNKYVHTICRHVCLFMHVCIHAQACICVYIYIYVCVCVCVALTIGRPGTVVELPGIHHPAGSMGAYMARHRDRV